MSDKLIKMPQDDSLSLTKAAKYRRSLEAGLMRTIGIRRMLWEYIMGKREMSKLQVDAAFRYLNLFRKEYGVNIQVGNFEKQAQGRKGYTLEIISGGPGLRAEEEFASFDEFEKLTGEDAKLERVGSPEVTAEGGEQIGNDIV